MLLELTVLEEEEDESLGWGLFLKTALETLLLWAVTQHSGAFGFLRSYWRILPWLVPTARLTPSWWKSTQVRGYSHWRVMTVLLAVGSQQTSFLSRPTESSRLALMGLKEMSLAGARWGLRLKMFLLVLQSQNESTPLSQLAARKDGWKEGKLMKDLKIQVWSSWL